MTKRISYQPSTDLIERWIDKELKRLNKCKNERLKVTKQELTDRLYKAAINGDVKL